MDPEEVYATDEPQVEQQDVYCGEYGFVPVGDYHLNYHPEEQEPDR